MEQVVKSQFTISSRQIGAEIFSEVFPWRILEETSPSEKNANFVTSFDLGAGHHDRVDDHLTAVRNIFLAHAKDLDELCAECNYALWVEYQFPLAEGAFNIHPSILATFAMFRVELIFNLKPTM